MPPCSARLLGQAYELERETKRQKVQDEKEESGVGFSVEQHPDSNDRADLVLAGDGAGGRNAGAQASERAQEQV